MARARNIKPAFFRDAKVVACSYEARLLFIGLWTLADYKGRLKYNPLEIKMELFPADTVDVDRCMQELSDNELIVMYRDHSGSTLVQVVNFEKHQNPHINERQDKDKNPLPHLPGPEDCQSPDDEEIEEFTDAEQRVKDALGVLSEYYQSDPADSLNLIPDSLKSLPERDSAANAPPPDDEKPKSKSRGTRLPDDWGLTDEHFSECQRLRPELLPHIEMVAGKFADHWRAQPGQKGVKVDWMATWRNWLRNEKVPRAQAPPSSNELRGRTLIDDLTDRSWAGAG